MGLGVAYRVVRVLGSGGMGAVYEVVDRNLGAPCVIKMLHPELAKSRPQLIDRFEREARVIVKINHPSIVRVTYLGRVQDGSNAPFYVMERLNGESLRDALARRGALRMDVALALGRDLFYALEAAHDAGVVHRDIKPENVIIHQEREGDLVAKLIDFGVMRLVADKSAEGFCGTPAYAPPEQIKEAPIDPSMDVFAAGSVLYEMLAGHRPYEAYGVSYEHAFARLTVPAPPLSKYGKFPRALEDLIMSTLSLEATGRPPAYRVASELAKILSAVQKSYDPHKMVTRQALGDGQQLGSEPVVTRITADDLAAPTDPDGPVPPWMQAMRASAKNAAILGEVIVPSSHKPVVGGMTYPDRSDMAFDATEPGESPLMSPAPMTPRSGPGAVDPSGRSLPANFRQLPTRDAPLGAGLGGPVMPDNGTEPMAEEIVDFTAPIPPPVRGATLRMDQLQAAFGQGLPSSPPAARPPVDAGLSEEERFQRTAARLAREVRELSPANKAASIPPASNEARPPISSPTAGVNGTANGGGHGLAPISTSAPTSTQRNLRSQVDGKRKGGGAAGKVAGVLVGMVLVLAAFGAALFAMNRMGMFGGGK